MSNPSPADHAGSIAQILVDRYRVSWPDCPDHLFENVPGIAIACVRAAFIPDISDADWVAAAYQSFLDDLGSPSLLN
jgi:hypothetical protein